MIESSAAPTRVLFVAEAVTLAHVARPVSLARGLAAQGFTPVLAVDPRFAAVCPTEPWQTEPLTTISSARFLAALASGSPIYDLATLRAYVESDLEVLRRVQPAVVVGDFRLSLAVSARLLQIPYINVTNAYWSPFARQRWHAPALPWVRLLPAAVADAAFRTARPLAFRIHAAPMAKLRREHGLPSLGHDLLRVYTEGDITLYADAPEHVPVFGAPASHRYLGPVPWSPALPLPAWWPELEANAKLIYVTLGSSGSAARLPGILEGLARLGLPVVVALAGAPAPERSPPGVRFAPYLPGDLVARRSALVVCNGGSPTSQQALAHGVPVLALPSNLDQFLNSSYLQAAGLARWLRPEVATSAAIERAAKALLDRGTRPPNAANGQSAAPQPAEVLRAAIDELIGVVPPPAHERNRVDASGRAG
ncbi:MAG: glycosyltransferase [Rhizobacter sp.]